VTRSRVAVIQSSASPVIVTIHPQAEAAVQWMMMLPQGRVTEMTESSSSRNSTYRDGSKRFEETMILMR